MPFHFGLRPGNTKGGFSLCWLPATTVHSCLVTMCDFPSYQQYSLLKMEIVQDEVVVQHYTEECDTTKPSFLWPIVQMCHAL